MGRNVSNFPQIVSPVFDLGRFNSLKPTPVNAFWSVTMYDGKTQLLIKNPIDRYLINSPMLPEMKKNADGSLTLYIQKDSPGADKESNWLPAPSDPIYMVMRLYWPRTEAPSILPPGEGAWQPPGIQKAATNEVSVDEAKQIAVDAYIYGYSLITTNVTRVQMTNVSAVEELRGPVNNFINVKRYPPADYRGVSAPNADTLYSVAWLDLAEEPIVFTYPDMGKRYFLFPMYSMQMNVVQSLGRRTTGEAAGTFLVPAVEKVN
jgi:hypothetical protein